MNYVALIGRLTKDPELKNLDSGKKYVRFTLAVDRFGDQVDFIPCIAWNKTAELVSNYMRKGKKLAIQGNLNVRSYKAQTGETRWTTDVLVDRIEFVDSLNSTNTNYNNGDDYSDNKSSTPFVDDTLDDDDDDFPF